MEGDLLQLQACTAQRRSSNFRAKFEGFLDVISRKVLNKTFSTKFVDCAEIKSSSNEAVSKEKIGFKQAE